VAPVEEKAQTKSRKARKGGVLMWAVLLPPLQRLDEPPLVPVRTFTLATLAAQQVRHLAGKRARVAVEFDIPEGCSETDAARDGGGTAESRTWP
jgi:hypothetical protein